MTAPPLWRARMIASDRRTDQAPLLRTTFTLDDGHGGLTGATLTATALGVYEAFVNGRPVAADVLSPGWSSYQWRLRYRTYDVLALLNPSQQANAIGLSLGNGWYAGRLGFAGGDHLYGSEVAGFAELALTYADGHVQVVATDASWRAGASATTVNQLYDGQTIDARLEPVGWSEPGYDDSSWSGVHVVDFDDSRLVEPIGDVVVRHESLTPQRIWRSAAGRTLVDFGQNLVGWVRVAVHGPRGQVITLRHAEVLEHGELGVRPLRDAKATDTYVLSGGDDVFEPTKTFHGFRYVEVDGWPGQVTADALAAVVVHTRMARIGRLETSHELLNQLHRNVVWGLRGNFLDLPTDCPQRNERLGWTGDIAVFAPSAAFLYDVKDFLLDWLADLAAEQRHSGYVPIVVPDIFPLQDLSHLEELFQLSPATAIWGDAAVWVPWALWQAYGDIAVLERQYESMAAHVRSAEALLSPSGLWDQGGQFADWLDPDAPPDDPAAAKADKGVVATAALFRSADLVARSASALGHEDDAATFSQMADRLKSAFTTHYVHPDGTIRSDCATVYALAIAFDLLEAPLRQAAGDRLAKIVADNGFRVSTGFAGTPFVTSALSDTGHLAEAYALLLETHCPSWLYTVTMGATTIWERWDSMLPDGTINPGEMTSFNHYALGAVADWMHRVIGGISPAEPGYRTIRVAPRPGGGLTWARSSLETPHGVVEVAWQLEDAEVVVDITVPHGCEAVVDLPGVRLRRLPGGSHRVSAPHVASSQ